MNKMHYICVILLIGNLFLIGCGKEGGRAEESTLKQDMEKAKPFMKAVSDYTNREVFVLLSYKYTIPVETVQPLLNDYTEQCPEYEEKMIFKIIEGMKMNETNFTSNHKEVLDKLSTQYNIPKEKLASMIIDYRLFAKKFLEE